MIKKEKIFFEDKRVVKDEIRIIGIDDSPFSHKKKEDILILGTIYRGGSYLEGIVSTLIMVDGKDATSKMISMINKSKHRDQLQVIMLDGIAVGGFNVVDIQTLSERTHLPVIVIMRNNPDFENVKKALQNLENWEERLKLMRNAGRIYSCKVGDGEIYFQCRGVSPNKSKEIIRISVTSGHMPEPIRTAHLIASGVVDGESRGRA